MIPKAADRIARAGRRGASVFLWGLAAGLAGALGVVLLLDHGWSARAASGPAPDAETSPAPTRSGAPEGSVLLAGGLPPGATVFVDGKAVEGGEAPGGLRVPVEATARRLEVRGRQGVWWSTRLTGSRGDTLHPTLGGELVVQVETGGPTGGLYLDGKLVGTAPGGVSDAPPGWHVLSVRNRDVVLFEDACDIRPGEVTVRTIPALPPKGKGSLTVRARVLAEDGPTALDGCTVRVDGERVGATPVDLTLRAGFHGVRVERAGYPPLVEVLYLEAGRSRYVNADFGPDEALLVQVDPPRRVDPGAPLAIPVTVTSGGESVLLREAALEIIREGQAKPLSVPLVASRTDTRLWVAVVPRDALGAGAALSGYASCVDELGRRGFSEIFRIGLD
jgi:hypothetical protein